MERCADSMDGWFFIFERTSPFRILRVIEFQWGVPLGEGEARVSWRLLVGTVLRIRLGVQSS
jgi:hypothetical protein